MTLTVVLVLIAMFLLSMATSFLQHRYYLATVNRLAAESHAPGLALVTGRGKGRLRGAVVVAVVRRDSARPLVQRASVMHGTTVFARFRERPDWVGLALDGNLPDVPPPVRKAVDDAVDRLRRMPATRG